MNGAFTAEALNRLFGSRKNFSTKEEALQERQFQDSRHQGVLSTKQRRHCPAACLDTAVVVWESNFPPLLRFCHVHPRTPPTLQGMPPMEGRHADMSCRS